MDESFKNRIILILGICAAIFFVGAIGSCTNASKQKGARDKEMAARLDAEEKMSKFSQEKSSSEDKLKAASKDLEEENAAHQATKKALVQEQLIGQSLKDELQKVTKLKDTLEEELKGLQANCKSAKSKR